MKIASANLEMTATHVASQRHEISESVRMWAGSERPDFEGRGRGTERRPSPRVEISDVGRAAQSAEATTKSDDDEAAKGDPRMNMIRNLIEMLTGRRVRIFDPTELQGERPAAEAAEAPPATQGRAEGGNRPAGYGVEYDRHESYAESEQTTFAASGTVRTADGREIGFDLSLTMSRSYAVESDVSLRLGDAARRKDPLVLNFAGNAASLTDTRFAFDIDSDGQQDQINFVGAGSGFLMLDRNGDGKATDGSELFGAASGDGFADLASLDGDGNGWIDENDAAYSQLSVWSRSESGADQYRSLQEAGVGAVALANVATPFDLKTAGNETLGQIRTSGIFLRENGEAGTIQQIDLTA